MVIPAVKKSLRAFQLVSIAIMMVNCWSLSAAVRPSEAQVINLGVANGLPSSICHAVEEDSRGFIWIGTPSGLVRYDGVFFELFTTNAAGVAGQSVVTLHQSPDGKTLWVGTTLGSIHSVRIADNKISDLDVDFLTIADTGAGAFSAFHQMNDSVLLAASNQLGLLKINIHSKVVSRILNRDGSISPQTLIRKIRVVDSVVYGISANGISTVETYRNGDLFLRPLEGTPPKTRDVIGESDSTLLIASGNTLLRYHKVLHTTELVSDFIFPVSKICMMESGQIWLATFSKGIICYQPATNETTYHGVGMSKYNLADNNIFALTRSMNGKILWIGTKKGLSRVDFRYRDIHFFDLVQFSDSKNTDVYMLKKDWANGYWIWSVDGLFRMTERERRFSRVKPSSSYANDDMILHAVETKNLDLLFASSKGILKYASKKNSFEYLPLQNKTQYYHITQVTDTSFCFLANGMFLIYNSVSGVERRVEIPGYNNLQLLNATPDGDSLLWIGSNYGALFKYDIRQHRIISTHEVLKNEKSYPSVYVSATQMDSQRRLWIASHGAGLMRYDVARDVITRINVPEMPGNSFFVLEKDKNGRMWSGNEQGIISIHPETGECRFFSKAKYVVTSEFNVGASDVGSSGEILMGGSKGFNELFPDSIKNKIPSGAPVITSCFAFRNSVFALSNYSDRMIYNPGDTVMLPRQYSSVRFHVRLLDFVGQPYGSFGWKTDDGDTVWHRAPLGDPIVFANLGYGTHTMLFSALDDRMQPVGEVRKVVIVNQVFFYNHPVFRIAVVLILFVLVIWFFRHRSQQIGKQKERLNLMVTQKRAELQHTNTELKVHREEITEKNKELVLHRTFLEDLVSLRTLDVERATNRAKEADRLKTAFLANLSHEVRTPMNSIMGFSSMLDLEVFSEVEKQEFIRLIQNSSEDLLALIGSIMEVSRLEAGQVQVFMSKVALQDVWHQVLQPHGGIVGTSVKLTVADNCPSEIDTDQEKLVQIMENLIGNALKFSFVRPVEMTASQLSLSELKHHFDGFYVDDDTPVLLVSVADKGIGISTEFARFIFDPFRKIESTDVIYPGLGLGLSIVKNYVGLLGGEVWVSSVPDEGSVFYFYLPVHHPQL